MPSPSQNCLFKRSVAGILITQIVLAGVSPPYISVLGLRNHEAGFCSSGEGSEAEIGMIHSVLEVGQPWPSLGFLGTVL